MRLIRAGDYKEMSLKAAQIIAAAITMKPDSTLGLATGGTPLGIYEYLAGWHARGHLDFSRVSAINLDEYKGLAPDAEQSYCYFMRKNLFQKINIKPENLHIPDGLAGDPAKECARYDAVIDSYGGADVQLLGIGNNGHIGFNEPGGEFVKTTHLVTLSESTIDANSRFFERRGDVPVQAYTMGIGSIMRARMILLAVSGEGKADILRRALTGGVAPSVPASILQFHNNLTVVGDEAALSMLKDL